MKQPLGQVMTDLRHYVEYVNEGHQMAQAMGPGMWQSEAYFESERQGALKILTEAGYTAEDFHHELQARGISKRWIYEQALDIVGL